MSHLAYKIAFITDGQNSITQEKYLQKISKLNGSTKPNNDDKKKNENLSMHIL